MHEQMRNFIRKMETIKMSQIKITSAHPPEKPKISKNEELLRCSWHAWQKTCIALVVG